MALPDAMSHELIMEVVVDRFVIQEAKTLHERASR